MSSNGSNSKKLSLIALILMIFTQVYGFNNMPRSFLLMGYGSIPFFILAAIFFFLPFAFMMGEYGAAFKDEKGGIYSWMEKSVNTKYAFIATFMWYSSGIIWMVNTAPALLIALSNAIKGNDVTGSLHFLGLNSPQVIGILGIIWILFVTIISSRGLDKIKKVTSIGGTAVAILNVVLIVGALVVLIGNHGQLAQPINSAADIIKSPNPAYQNPFAILSFLVFAIFAFGGIEVVGGLVDETENAEKTFPKGLTISAIIIAVGYCVGLFCIGMFTNWNDVLSSDKVHMANVGYIVMQNLGYQIGQVFGATQQVSMTIGLWVARFVGLSMFLCLCGAFFAMTYSPLKQLIEGSPKGLFSDKITKTKNDIPVTAMWIQAITVIVIIALVSFGGDTASKFFDVLISMTNVAATLPYMFLSFAFIFFKRKQNINKPFIMFKGEGISLIFTIIVTATIGFANIFSIIEPALNHDWLTAFWSVAGPVFFTIVALLIFKNYEKKQKNLK